MPAPFHFHVPRSLRLGSSAASGLERAIQRATDAMASRLASTAAIMLAGALLGLPCQAAEPWRIERLEVIPPSLEFRSPDREHGLLATAITTSGERIDVTTLARFTAVPSSPVRPGIDGACAAVADGTGTVEVEFGGQIIRVPVTVSGLDSGARTGTAVSFRQDVLPVLTRAGCNMGACHGKLAGQNGFKLSLRGYAPEQDIASLVSDVTGRRLNPSFPDESLLLLKAVGAVPHEGGQRFAPGSRPYRTLAAWIAGRAPGPRTNEADVVKLELLPGPAARVLRPGATQRLLARAHHADGRVRDVTWLTQFFSNDENTASVTPDGLVRALRPGETSIRAHFLGQVEVLTVSIPYDAVAPAREYARRHNAIDGPVFDKLAALRLPPSAACDDATFLRRASLDATGRLPSPEEARAFATDQRRDKRARLVERLLASPEFVDYWTLQLADLLQNRRERDHDVRGAKGVRSFQQWLRGEVAANRPWNELARAVLTSAGSVEAQPAVGYFIYNVGEKSRVEESDIPDAVAQAFLGTRIGCARCHNHPLERYTQDDFYHFAAFFAKVQMKRAEPDKGVTALQIATREEDEQRKRVAEAEKGVAEAEKALDAIGALQARAWPGGISSTNAGSNPRSDTGADPLMGPAIDSGPAQRKADEQRRRLAEARKRLGEVERQVPTVLQPRTRQAMAPRSLDRAPQPSAYAPGEDPRERLAAWMVDPSNPYFSGAMVNRIWKHYLGVGLVEPVDDLRASNPPSNPALWRLLNETFVRSGYDLRALMRLILNSRTYQLSASTRPGNETDRRFHSHYQARRLPAEVMLDAIAQATGVPDEFKGYPVGLRAVQLPEPGVSSYFLTLFGRSDRVTACACERNGEVTLPQLLHLQNGDATGQKIRAAEGRLASLLKEPIDDARRMEELFLATLGRLPRAAEKASVERALGGSGAQTADREEAFRDLFWALLNSKEFAFNH